MTSADQAPQAENVEDPNVLRDDSFDCFPPTPGPVRIIRSYGENHSFVLSDELLAKILLDPRYVDKKVALVSVAGAFRKGKSFLLNFFLRYLSWRQSNTLTSEWLAAGDTLNGFSWRGGSERETNGILLWSEPFVVKDANNEEIVVLLMDTQGTFDSVSTVKECATIFALSTMLSSLQIYNIGMNIQEDDLQHLQLFTEYGKLALADSSAKPFQSLLFLVRDWNYVYEAEYGFQGGQRILDKRLEIDNRQHPELRQLREQIHESFESLKCFLMPHPGLEVARKQEFRGELSDIDKDFKEQLNVLVPRLLDSNTLKVKSVNGQPVTCRGLFEYFKTYIEVFQGDDMPEPTSILQATANANNLAALSSAKALYIKEMEEVCGGDAPYLSSEALYNEHNRCLTDAIQDFKKARKIGGADLSIKFLERLMQDIDDQYVYLKKSNEGKNIFKSMRTPAVLIVVVVINYILQQIFLLIGASSIAGIFSSFVFLTFITIVLWCYSRYSGSLREVAVGVDKSAAWLYENIIKEPVVADTVKACVQAAMNSTSTNSTSTASGARRRN